MNNKSTHLSFAKGIHFSPDIEYAVLGACIIERAAFGKIYNAIDADNFYYEGSKIVFSTIRDMYINGIPIDFYTVLDQLQRVQGRELIHRQPVGEYLTSVTMHIAGSAHIEYHAYIIKSMWMEREIMILTSGGRELHGDAREKITSLQDKLSTLQQKAVSHDWKDMTDLIVQLYQHQAEMAQTGGIGIACGIKELDRSNGGFHNGQMIVLGARPSVGKSALAGSFAMHIAGQGKKVGIVSLEMNNIEIAARLAALDTNTDFSVLYRGLYRDEHQSLEVYKKIGDHTSRLPIYVSDATNVDVIEIRSKADKLKSVHGLDFLIIDYLQLIDAPESNNRTRENEISKISRYCKIMAKELDIPVMLLCQLNRQVTMRGAKDRQPVLSDLRESGSIEQDADVVMFLHRDWMAGYPTHDDGSSTEFEADLIVRKWRNGRNNFAIDMDFIPGQMKFVERKNPHFTNLQRPQLDNYQDDNPF